jgi:serine protease Do
MARYKYLSLGLLLGLVSGGLLVGPWLNGQTAVKTVPPPKELASYRDVVKQVLPAVVCLEAEAPAIPAGQPKLPGDPPPSAGPLPGFPKKKFDDPVPLPKQGFGSGVIVQSDGVILTTYHVVAGYATVTVHMLDGSKYVTSDIRTDKKTDLAIVKIDAKGKKLPYLEFGDSDQMEAGDRVLALGAPFGLRGSVTQGIISARGRNGLNMNVYEDFLQTDAAINAGSSGGPLVNLEGRVIGINAAIKSRSGGFSGVGLAVSSNLARGVKDALLKQGKVKRGYLGAQVLDLEPDLAKKLGLTKAHGAVVSVVFKNTPAAKAGLQPGDVILKVVDKTVFDGRHMQELIMNLPLDKAATLEILRDGKQESVTVTIVEQPESFGKAAPQ